MSLDFYLHESKTKCPHCGAPQPAVEEIYSQNATHNLGRMWVLAGVYDALYMSDGKRAGDYIGVLDQGLAKMVADPEPFKALNPSNGWGSYESAVGFLRDTLNACQSHPEAIIRVSK